MKQVSAELPDSVAVPADMTRVYEVEGIVRRTMEHFGRVDVLVNCAGQGYDAPVEKTKLTLFIASLTWMWWVCL